MSKGMGTTTSPDRTPSLRLIIFHRRLPSILPLALERDVPLRESVAQGSSKPLSLRHPKRNCGSLGKGGWFMVFEKESDQSSQSWRETGKTRLQSFTMTIHSLVLSVSSGQVPIAQSEGQGICGGISAGPVS